MEIKSKIANTQTLTHLIDSWVI